MKTKSVLDYYWFGLCSRYIQDAKEGIFIHGDGYILKNIDSFLDRLKELGLIVTSRAAKDLMKFRDSISKLPESTILDKQQADNLKKIMINLRSTLDAEIAGFEIYTVTPKILDVNKLLNDVGSLFAPEIFGRLPDIAQYDFIEAGKCIAFERPTAAAFHILRGTEAVLREFYCYHIRHNRVKDLMWGVIVTDMRTKARTKKNETLHSNLDNIRKSFRNPTQHPEKIYDISEVQDLWSICVEVINRMGKTLPEQEMPF